MVVDESRVRGARIEIQALSKAYGDVHALRSVELEIQPGEFLALLGPSGSGKTTLLMSLAGFEDPTAGRIVVDGRDVLRVPAHKRDLGMMFQRYALFPHLNVRRNIEYPLRARGVSAAERRRLVEHALALVSLPGYGHRRVGELSGGQQQRVALARAIVFSPSLLLMDEPLGALDQQLREQVQLELRSLHKQLGATIVFVTHDQKEAMTMADRIAVMDNAEISQVGTPRELYERPQNRFVAGFIGEMNFLNGAITAITPDAVAVSTEHLDVKVPRVNVFGDAAVGSRVSLGVRPHNLRIVDSETSGLDVAVEGVVFRGSTCLIVGYAGAQHIVCELAAEDASDAREGENLRLGWQAHDALLYVDEPAPHEG